MRLGDCDQLDIIGRSARFCRRASDLLPDAIKILGDQTHVKL
jgi:hypothetical protein